jgi:hypothetical protein
MSDHSYSLSDGYGQDLVSAGAVSSYHWTGDVEDLLAEDLFPETEDMETEDCQGDGEGNSPDEHNVDSLAAPGKGSGQGVSEGLMYQKKGTFLKNFKRTLNAVLYRLMIIFIS